MSKYTEAIHLSLPEAGWHRGGDGKLRIRRNLRLPEENGWYLYDFTDQRFLQLDSGSTVRTSRAMAVVVPIRQRDAAVLAKARAHKLLQDHDIQVVSALAAYALDGIAKRKWREDGRA